MRLTVLGVNGPYPAPGGACSGYLLESDSGESRVLLECGAGVLGRLQKFAPVESLNGVVLSHLHYDHMSDMLVLQYALQFSRRETAIPVLLPDAPGEIRRLLERPCFDLYAHRDMRLGEMQISFIPGVHPVPGSCVAIACDGVRVVFSGDTNVNPLLELFAQDADLLLMDAGLSHADWSEQAPHLSAGLCGKIAHSAKVRQLLLTHLNPRYAPQELLAEAREAYPAAELARPGAVYTV